MCFKSYEMQHFALPLALYIKNRRRCWILQDSVNIHETASKSEIKKSAVISPYIFMF